VSRHLPLGFWNEACTGLYCARPECRKRRKARLRKAAKERRETTGWGRSFQRHPAEHREPVIIQDDRWRLEVEARAMR